MNIRLCFQLKEEALKKELHTTRLALIKQVCNHNADPDRIDDIVSKVFDVPTMIDYSLSDSRTLKSCDNCRISDCV